MALEHPEFKTAEEAVAFVEAVKLMFTGKTGFTHFVAELDALQKHILELDEENRRLKDGMDG